MRIKGGIRLFGIGLVLVILALAVGIQGQIALGDDQQPPCTVTVAPGQSIQKAIDSAPDGAVICLKPGEWEENLVIKKSITLRGAGMDKTIIRGKDEGKPVIIVYSDSEIEVIIEGLTVTEAKESAGIRIGGKAKVIIRRSQISGNSDGIVMIGFSRTMITDSVISDNGRGIDIEKSAQAMISSSEISDNDCGMWMEDFSQAEVSGNRFLHNRDCGIGVWSERASVYGGRNEMRGNGADLVGYAPAFLRQPLVLQTESKALSVPGDYSSIQEAIDAIAPGGTITVAPGTYKVGLTIWKPLTIRGAGKDKTVLKPLSNPTRKLIVSIIARAKGVALDGLAISGSKWDGLLVHGEASLEGLQISGNNNGIEMMGSSKATISNSEISRNDGDGIEMWDSAQVRISGLQISENRRNGVEMGFSSQAAISNSRISGNGKDGIRVWTSSRIAISSSQISKNRDGISMWGSSQAAIASSQISGNVDYGIEMGDSSQATISGVEISENRWEGILMKDSSQVEISSSTFSESGEDGILIEDSSQATIRKSKILKNTRYGVALYIKHCGFYEGQENFAGKVEGSGNEIYDNGKRDVCPTEISFLMTEEGGELDRQK